MKKNIGYSIYLVGKGKKIMSEELQIDPLIISFGKYKGKSIIDISKTDISYCKWLLSQPFSSDYITEYINDNVNVDDYIMKWGKYKNRTVSYIKSIDSKYIEWLQNNKFVLEKCPALIEALK